MCPKYQEIVKDLLDKIHNGDYPPESRLPSENEMSELYAVSVPTVRRALFELVHMNMIYRIKGNGTFVCPLRIDEKQIPNADSIKRNAHDICFLLLVDASDNSIMKMIRGSQKYLLNNGYSLTIM